MRKRPLTIKSEIIISDIYELIENMSDEYLKVFYEITDVLCYCCNLDELYADLMLSEENKSTLKLCVKNVAKETGVDKSKLLKEVNDTSPVVIDILLKCFAASIHAYGLLKKEMTPRQLINHGIDRIGRSLSGYKFYIN